MFTYLLTNNNNTAGAFFSDAIKIDFQNSSMNCSRFGFDMQQKQKKSMMKIINFKHVVSVIMDVGLKSHSIAEPN